MKISENNHLNHYYIGISSEIKNYIGISSEIKKVIYNPPATIVLWRDGVKTVVKCRPEDEYNKELGLLYCIAKKYFITSNRFHKEMKKWCWDDIYNNVETSQDDLSIFDSPKLKTRLQEYFQQLSLSELMKFRLELIVDQKFPKAVADILCMPNYIYSSFSSLPRNIALRTIQLLIDITDDIIKDAVYNYNNTERGNV